MIRTRFTDAVKAFYIGDFYRQVEFKRINSNKRMIFGELQNIIVKNYVQFGMRLPRFLPYAFHRPKNQVRSVEKF